MSPSGASSTTYIVILTILNLAPTSNLLLFIGLSPYLMAIAASNKLKLTTILITPHNINLAQAQHIFDSGPWQTNFDPLILTPYNTSCPQTFLP